MSGNHTHMSSSSSNSKTVQNVRFILQNHVYYENLELLTSAMSYMKIKPSDFAKYSEVWAFANDYFPWWKNTAFLKSLERVGVDTAQLVISNLNT